MKKISIRAISLPLVIILVPIFTVLLIRVQYWRFCTGMTKIPVDQKHIQDSFPVVVMESSGNNDSSPVVDNNERIQFVITHFYSGPDEWLNAHSYLLPPSRIDEIRSYVTLSACGWLTVKDIGENKQYVNVYDVRACHGLVKHAGWYIANNKGYKPLYYAEYLVPNVLVSSFLVSLISCFAFRLICLRILQKRYAQKE